MKIIVNLSCVLFLLSWNLSFGQTQEGTTSEEPYALMSSAFSLGSTLLWDKSISEIKQSYDQSQSSEDLLDLCYAYYGKAGICIGMQKEEEGEAAIELGLSAATKLADDKTYASEAYAMLAGFNGLAIAFSPMKGMFLGPKSDNQISKSLEMNSENALAWLQQGSSQYNTPRIFGGSAKKSVDSFKKSIAYFDNDPAKPEWLKLEAMIWLGQAYHYLEEYESAQATYEEVLIMAPSHEWVLELLLPATRAKLNN